MPVIQLLARQRQEDFQIVCLEANKRSQSLQEIGGFGSCIKSLGTLGL